MSTRKPGADHRATGHVTPTANPVTPPPHSIETEQCVLGGLMLDNSTWPSVNARVNKADFYLAAHQLIYHEIENQASKGRRFDMVTVAEQLESQQLIEDAGGWQYIARLARDTPSAANTDVHASITHKKALERRRLAAIAQEDHHQAAALTAAIDALAASHTAGAAQFIEVHHLCSQPPTENWLIKGYLALDSLALIFGDPGCGKSFLAIDIAGHVATGSPWRGQKVRRGKVLYIAGEGRNGLARRFKAWFDHHDEPPRNIDLLTHPIQLTDPASTAALVAKIRERPDTPTLIVIDTINRNYGPGDENATADMTAAVASLDALRMATGATLLGLHHSGHAEKGRGRGSSVLRAAMDCEYALEKFDKTMQLNCTKAKDFDHPLPLAWNLQKQTLPWADEDGNPLDSAVPVPSDLPAPAQKPKTDRMGANQSKALETLRTLYQRNRENLEDAGLSPASTRVTRQDWYATLKDNGFLKQRCYESKVDLVKRGLVREEGDYVFLMDEVTDLVTDLVTEE